MTDYESKFPIGECKVPTHITRAHVLAWCEDIATFPERLKKEVLLLNDEQLDMPYRQEGWTIRQVIHHCADSHMNSFIRFKLALTEDKPTIKPYLEHKWAELADSKYYPISDSLKILEGLHKRWTQLLQQLSAEDLKRTFIHPQQGKETSLQENIGLYAWHANHHLAHITRLKEKKGWK